jgi:hypothetical protein
MTIQDKNDRPTNSRLLKMWKPEVKSSELMHPISENLTITPGGIASLNSRLLSPAFENHEGRYEVPNGTATGHDSCCHFLLCIQDLLNCFIIPHSYSFIGYEIMPQSTITSCINGLRLTY